jgi:integrase
VHTDPCEVEALLTGAQGSDYCGVIYMAVSSDMRQAELLGLLWRDVDPNIMMSISISQILYKRKGVCEFKEPKTTRSRRRVNMTDKLACYLREYKLGDAGFEPATPCV